jgi:hypothetical protein
MQDRGYEVPRISLLRGWVNREEAGGPLEGASRLASPYGRVLVHRFLFVQV